MVSKFGPDKIHRTRRLEPALHQILSMTVLKELPHLHLSCQISRVKMSKCMSYLDIYVIGDDRAKLEELRKSGWLLRKSLTSQPMRYIPTLRIHWDEEFEKQQRVAEALLLIKDNCEEDNCD